ncbi:glutamate 5-kinase [Helicobacter sp. 14348-15]|uniref:Glutamate 5-kinase n=1 Tax=Helicobacter colisuis TaxID=2949739 RepID=A0ABT0TSR4_9HELI|nr:glutamate 5-kinase [Helicobacter colisuis]MCL9818730.1 glutamate 5-kinase [Helicobacter colisuis]MCL9820243.1 glutamate 5-kinase [Helicobacter colisuis]
MQKSRVVIKVGSALLVKNQLIDKERMEALASLISKLRQKYEVILVSSGAVAAGFTKVKLSKGDLANKQALAAIGQPLLMQTYAENFAIFGIATAQVLLSAYDFDSRKRTQNARNAMEVLLQNEILPIINENDVTATGELSLLLEFGDNDQLSAHVTHFFNADILAILSDIEGYYDENPSINPAAKIYPKVSEISAETLKEQATPNNAFATGGIVTKLKAADFLLRNHRKMFLSSGKRLEVLEKFLLEGIQVSGTLFEK